MLQYSKEQDEQFYQAVKFFKKYNIINERYGRGYDKSKEIINNSFNFNRNPKL